MKQIHTEILIDASAERVWQVLTGFADFPDWNPLFRSAKGDLTPGSQLEIHIQPQDGKGRQDQGDTQSYSELDDLLVRHRPGLIAPRDLHSPRDASPLGLHRLYHWGSSRVLTGGSPMTETAPTHVKPEISFE